MQVGGLDIVLAASCPTKVFVQVVDFNHKASAKSTLLWRVTFRHLLISCKDEEAVQSVFSHGAGQEQLMEFAASLLTFLRCVVGPWLAEQEGADETLALQRLQLAEVTLKNGY